MRSREERQAARAANNAKFRERCDAADQKAADRNAAMQDKAVKLQATLDERVKDRRYEYWTYCAEMAESLVQQAAAEPNARKSKDLARRAAKFAKSARKTQEKMERNAA